MTFKENVPLAPYTTFKLGGPARFFCIAGSEKDLAEAIDFARKERRRFLVLGGGSNILISDAGFSGVVVKNEIKGIKIEKTGPHEFTLSAGAGESWDDVVEAAVSRGLYGIENLSSIPGTVGAAPVQNIGAYGSEIGDSIVSVRALDTKRKMKPVSLSKEECAFGYRDSIFKHKKGRYAITGVDLKLTDKGTINIGYKDLSDYFSKAGISAPTLAQVRAAVIDIRSKKLPDWKLWGTAGSFFKNPVISKRRYDRIKKEYPGLPGYPEPDGRMKVSLGWILDHICKVKGAMANNVGAYQNQALVIVTKPGATAAQVVERTKEIAELVEKMTSIKVEAEVEWVN